MVEPFGKLVDKSVQTDDDEIVDLRVSSDSTPHSDKLIERLNNHLKLKTVPHVVAIDIEGAAPNIVEISAIISIGSEWIDARVWWYLRPSDLFRAARDGRYSHGIPFPVLTNFPRITVEEVQTQLKEWIATFIHPCLIVSPDENPHSDVFELVKPIGLKYYNVPLPKWKYRIDTWSHREIQKMKSVGHVVNGVTCKYHEIYAGSIIHKGHTKDKSGSHCSFMME
jgi:hypothetical protein